MTSHEYELRSEVVRLRASHARLVAACEGALKAMVLTPIALLNLQRELRVPILEASKVCEDALRQAREVTQ